MDGDGNKGLFDVLFYKRSFQSMLITWGLSLFKQDPEAPEWILEAVATKVKDFATWARSERPATSWGGRAGGLPRSIG